MLLEAGLGLHHGDGGERRVVVAEVLLGFAAADEALADAIKDAAAAADELGPLLAGPRDVGLGAAECLQRDFSCKKKKKGRI